MDRAAALRASKSGSWEERAEAASVLASLGDAEADRALVLLLDDDNLAVIQSASSALLAMATPGALRRFTSAYAAANVQVGMSMRDVLWEAVPSNPALRPAFEALARSGDAGAQEALRDLP